MIILWDSSSMLVTCGLVDGSEVSASEWQADRTLAREMLGYLRDRLAEQGKDFSDVSGIGVFRGPGSFTGLRIGLTVLNTLAAAKSIPIVGVTGVDWQDQALVRLEAGENDTIVLPEYGSPAHVTTPRK